MSDTGPQQDHLIDLSELPAQLARESPDRLTEILYELVSKPGHEKVRALIHDLLVNGLGIPSTAITYEHRLPEVHGRMDAFLGRTVLEFKTDLKYERLDAEEELTRYLGERRRATGLDYLGVATDGSLFIAYELKTGLLTTLGDFKPNRDAPGELLVWLDGLVNVLDRLPPEPHVVQRELGRDSLAYTIARDRLIDAWRAVAENPDCVLKRQLWARLMRFVYGKSVEDDELFVQHTYLTIVAKTMAARVLGLQIPGPADLLSGSVFESAGIYGAVESDFFDWVLTAPGGEDLVSRIATQADKFKLGDVDADVLKGLYESLVDPGQRHDLGEYYTPDWLAAMVCREAIVEPLGSTVLDPACGSGTFLFQSVRLLLDAADEAGWTVSTAIARCAEAVRGVDVHPVAVMIARVTYLLAIGEARLAQRGGPLRIPVYMGDSLQWDTSTFIGSSEIRIRVPGGDDLEFPTGTVDDPSRFEETVNTMLAIVEAGGTPESFGLWLGSEGFDPDTSTLLLRTFKRLDSLYRSGRDHVWGYVIRNLARPVWLASPEEKSDVVVGNPPWLSYQYMSSDLRTRFKAEAKRLGVWEGSQGRLSHQDMSALFFARSVELYLKPTGKIAFVMPMAAMSRSQFASFRTGDYGSKGSRLASVQFKQGWAFGDSVWPLFPVPSCVLIADVGIPGSLPIIARTFSGRLPQRNPRPSLAAALLMHHEEPWPDAREDMAKSVYSDSFRQGAIIVPRMLFMVERVRPTGMLGGDPTAPLVRSRRTTLEKLPWRELDGLSGPIEVDYLRSVYMGESIVLYMAMDPREAVIPWDERSGILLSASTARQRGRLRLAAWLDGAEALWTEHGKGDSSIVERLDYIGQLSSQFPIAPLRVVFAASGSQPAACLLTDSTAVIEHGLYWSPVDSEAEGKYLVTILNSEEVRKRAEHLQSRGQFGARHFDKAPLSLPIPKFDKTVLEHKMLVDLHDEALVLCRLADMTLSFQRVRRMQREALVRSGVQARIDSVVAGLLG